MRTYHQAVELAGYGFLSQQQAKRVIAAYAQLLPPPLPAAAADGTSEQKGTRGNAQRLTEPKPRGQRRLLAEVAMEQHAVKQLQLALVAACKAAADYTAAAEAAQS